MFHKAVNMKCLDGTALEVIFQDGLVKTMLKGKQISEPKEGQQKRNNCQITTELLRDFKTGPLTYS